MINFRPYERKRYTRTFVNGVNVAVLESTATIYGNLQPVSDGELQNMPEGFRSLPGKKFKLYTNGTTILRSRGDSLDGEPDQIEFNGVNLYVHGETDWSGGLLSYRKYVLTQASTETGRDA